MAYQKVFLKGSGEVKTFDWGKITKVSIHIDDLLEKAKSGEIYVSDTGYVSFDVVEKKAEKQKYGEPTHYLAHSKKVPDGELPEARF